MSSILFAHNNLPAQFGFLAEAATARGYQCAAIASSTGRPMPNVPVERWDVARSSTPTILHEATRAEADLIRGRAAADAALRLKRAGFDPDVITGHPGWGETLYKREIFPAARQMVYAEYCYRTADGDVVVAAGGDGLWLPGRRVGHGTGARCHRGRGEWTAGRFYRP